MAKSFKKAKRELTTLVLEQILCIAGHVKNEESPKPCMRFLPEAILWKGRQWWQTVQIIGPSDTNSTQDRWRHASLYRKRGQWEDVLVEAFGVCWPDVLRGDATLWDKGKRTFVEAGYKMVAERGPEPSRIQIQLCNLIPEKEARAVSEESLWWAENGGGTTQLVIIGDSLLITRWCQRVWNIKALTYKTRVNRVVDTSEVYQMRENPDQEPYS